MTHKHLTFLLSVLMSIVACAVMADSREYVDLGLPSGTLWATCNVGSNRPEEYGDYFACGETVPYGGIDESNANNYDRNHTYMKTYFNWNSYKYCTGGSSTLTKYCTDSSYGRYGFTDNLTELLPEDDAAMVNWGSEWRMPSEAQFRELINSSYTTTEWTTMSGVYGRKITSKVSGYAGNFIFLPAAGRRDNSSLDYAASNGYYWSRTLSPAFPSNGFCLYFHSSNIASYYDYHRCLGQSVRPVRVSHIPATGIALSLSSLSLVAGSSAQLTATVSPVAAAATVLTWSSSDTEVAMVGSDGVVVAVGTGTCTITCETTDGSNVSATCEVTVTTAFVNNVNFIDGGAYDNGFAQEVGTITYTRNFSNKNWQALYVPFEMQYEDWKDDFELARINNVNQYDDDDDGNVDRTVLEVFKVKSGQTEAHTPYLIKAKTMGEKTISLINATLYKAEEKSYDVSSWNTLYTFTGTYTGVSGATMFSEGYYALGSGSLHQAADATNALSPMRWYMAVTDRDGNPKNIGEVKVVVFGMEEDELIETGLEEVGRDAISTNEQPVFDLNGRRVTNPRKGLYIKNGKKFMVK